MFSIGDFANHGRVSVRMLRHYDAIGLLVPARTDPATGYRWYEAAQLSRLNRIVALKELGFTLEQVLSIVDDKVDAAELRGMLRLRRAQLQSQVDGDLARLSHVDARLQLIEMEGIMPVEDIAIKPLPAVRVAETSAVAASFEPASISPVIRSLYAALVKAVEASTLTCLAPGIAYYEDAPGGGILVHASVPVNAEPGAYGGFAVIDLPAVEQAATIVHRGSMENVVGSLQTLARWIEAHELRSAGYPRECYLSMPEDEADWVTELQEPVRG